MMAILFNQESVSGGGIGEGVTLWENDPFASFGAKTIDLNQSYKNFDYIGIVYDQYYGSQYSLNREMIMSVAEFEATSNTSCQCFGGQSYTGSGITCRKFYQVSDTQISIGANSAASANVNLPIRILGYNKA